MKLRLEKLILILSLIALLLSVTEVYADNTYTGTLTEGAIDPPVEVYLNDEFIGNYSDYGMHEASLVKDQQIRVTLEVPASADFDLFVYTADETSGWGSYSTSEGEDEALEFTVPETGTYRFYAADWSGSGSYTLRWEILTGPTPSTGPQVSPSQAPSPVASPSSQPIFGLDYSSWTWIIAIIIIIVFLIVVVALLMRRRKGVPPPPAYGLMPPPPPPPVQSPQPASTPQATAEPQPPTVQPQTGQPAPTCPSCGGQLTWIPEYQRWYCYRESKYA